MRTSLGALLLAVACLASCGGAPFPRETSASNARTDDTWLEGPRCADGPIDLTGLRTEDVQPGPGKLVGDGDTVRIHYVAKLADGTVVHDTEADTPPIEIILGSSKILCGVEKGLLGMRAGAQRKIYVPSKLAFGESGKPPSVPPRSDLVVLVDLFVPAEPNNEQRSRPAAPRRGGGAGGAGGAGGGLGRPGH